MLPSVCAPKCRGAGLQIELRCMTLRCALDFVPNGKFMLRKCDAVQWFSWLRMAEQSQDQKEAV